MICIHEKIIDGYNTCDLNTDGYYACPCHFWEGTQDAGYESQTEDWEQCPNCKRYILEEQAAAYNQCVHCMED